MKRLTLVLKGLAMGAADVVPGVSGGTIAFITGIYDELLGSINSVNKNSIGLLLKGKLKEFWAAINGNFLAFLFLGIGIAIFSLAKLFSFLLENYPVQLWAFFFGLIVGSVWLVGSKIKTFNWKVVLALIAGTAISYWITILPPTESSDSLGYLFLSGCIAIIAMILPGISGSFILLLMGSYTTVLGAVKNMDFVKIGVFMIGCVVGLLSFSRILKWTLDKYRDLSIAVLTGFLVGSLNKIWPWKENVSTRTNSHGEIVPFIQENVSPKKYSNISTADIELGITEQVSNFSGAAIFCLVGLALILIFWKLEPKEE
jgi:putative membrane protein